MYADDTNFTVYGRSANKVEKSLNKEIENIHKWLLTNRLTPNVEKTEYMITESKIEKNCKCSVHESLDRTGRN